MHQNKQLISQLPITLWPIIDYLKIVFDHFRYAFQFTLKCYCITGSIRKCVLHDDLHISFKYNNNNSSDNYRLLCGQLSISLQPLLIILGNFAGTSTTWIYDNI